MPLKRVTASVASLGWINGLLYLAGRALQRISGGRASLIRYILVAQPVPPNGASPCRPSASSPIRMVAPDDPLVSQFPRPSKVIERRFRVGAQCFAAQAADRFTGFLWLARGAYDEDEVRCRYELARPELAAWDFDVYVEPDFRLGRTFARLWGAANSHLAAQGVRWSFSRISAFNPGSLASHARLGIRPLYSATFVRLGRAQIAFIGAAPYLHVSMSPASRPVLRLAPPPHP
jgi:hypothetical protein